MKALLFALFAAVLAVAPASAETSPTTVPGAVHLDIKTDFSEQTLRGYIVLTTKIGCANSYCSEPKMVFIDNDEVC